MEFIKIIRKRRSVRNFKENDEISKKEIDLILEAAKWSPSAKNLQPIEYVIIENEKIRKELSVACHQNQPEYVPLVITVIGNLNVSKKLSKILPYKTKREYNETHVFTYMDAAAAIENMLLTATSLGIDSLWISGFEEDEVSKTLKLPKDYIPLAILCFGHRSKPITTPKKRDVKEGLHFNNFKE